MKTKIFVGVSGGVDSAAAVLLLKEAGYDVTGVSLWMCGERPDTVSLSECLDVPVVSADVRSFFESRVVRPFVAAYLCGETPSPCAECNASVKWAVLKRTADRYETGSGLATGHYCRVVRENGHYYVAKGVDRLKDQSYYLWNLSQDVLSRAVMPLGGLLKAGVKQWMSGSGYGALSQRKESMGVCFLEGKKYGAFLKERRPELEALRDGIVEDTAGNPVGRHEGYPFYTVAQRRGRGIPAGRCVVGTDARRNVVVTGLVSDLFVSEFTLRDWRVTCEDEFFSAADLTVAVRGIGENPAGYATVQRRGTRLLVRLPDASAWALACGQPAVFYIGDRVAGGGIIENF